MAETIDVEDSSTTDQFFGTGELFRKFTYNKKDEKHHPNYFFWKNLFPAPCIFLLQENKVTFEKFISKLQRKRYSHEHVDAIGNDKTQSLEIADENERRNDVNS